MREPNFRTCYINRLTPSKSWLPALTDGPQQTYSLYSRVKAPEATQTIARNVRLCICLHTYREIVTLEVPEFVILGG